MNNEITQPSPPEPTSLNRRSALLGIGGVAALSALAGCQSGSDSGFAPKEKTSGPPDRGAELILLGTYGGPPVFTERTGISSALAVDGKIYLVDCGRSAVTQYAKAGLEFGDLQNIFITHLHADHIADYYNFLLLSGAVPTNDGDILKSVGVYGPGPAGGLPEKFGGGHVSTVAADAPTPGIDSMTNQLHRAYAYSTNLFMRDSDMSDIRKLADVREVEAPSAATFENTAPTMEPFTVMEDSRVKVTAVLVPHGPVFPSFAYRFDTDYGSVTFSGDTTKSENLVRLAKDTTILVHEAINIEGTDLPDEFKSHMLESHVEVQEVGSVANQAKAQRLVLSHIADRAEDPIDGEKWKRWAEQGFDGEVYIGEDLQRFTV